MRPHRLRTTTGHSWGRTVEAAGDTSMGRRAAWIAPAPSPRASYEPPPLRGQLRRLVVRLDLP
jgi:hypothetical protein